MLEGSILLRSAAAPAQGHVLDHEFTPAASSGAEHGESTDQNGEHARRMPELGRAGVLSYNLVVVRSETLVRWHRQAWQLFGRWRARARLSQRRAPGCRACRTPALQQLLLLGRFLPVAEHGLDLLLHPQPAAGPIHTRPVLGGHDHVYEPVA